MVRRYRSHHELLSSGAVRLRLGRGLSVSLEFLLAADILETAVAPTWNEIGQVASIVILRTVLNYFLDREIRAEAEHERRENPPRLAA